ncbi:MAG TPA: tRNA pseudouridine(13) synthase TruD [Candidatus Bathyarchaeia archaeon]|nr:tRNA pseudouridine(13) synthase TruD [Candidatus Bathyarchaeia archaeon]
MTETKAVPESDVTVGMMAYLTTSRGIGGRIRQSVEDFVVNEVYADRFTSEGRYQLVKVTKTDTETHHMVRDLSRRLQISQRRIGWAGTKDKRAVTTQRMSIDSIRLVEPVSFGTVVAEPIGRSDRPVSLGDLDGNDFIITVRAVEGPQNKVTGAVGGLIEEIRNARGLPNFFGIQRFGSIRPVNHIVGRALVEGDLERAVMTYIAKPFLDEPDDVKAVRQSVAETYDFKEALKRMPVRLRYERAMLNHLAKYPNDFDGALGVLSTNLQKLFVHAFQSYLFNRMVSSRLEWGLPLAVGFDGDRVRAPDRERVRTVVPKNVHEVNQSLAAGTASVQMPVPGYDTELSDGVIGQIERDVLASAGVDLDAFRIESCPRLASKGVMRNVLLPADIRFDVAPDELSEDRMKVELRFFLPKGGYATTVLREVMKTRLG